jgi:hypothetical protein
LALIELAPPVLARVLEPFPIPVQTLDAMRLGSIQSPDARGRTVELGRYDERQLAAAHALIFRPSRAEVRLGPSGREILLDCEFSR